MKFIFVALFLIPFSAKAQQLCEFFDLVEQSGILELQVPNCLNQTNLDDESFTQSSTPPEAGAFCDSCRSNLNARITIPANDRKRLRQEAYFRTMHYEFEKTMATLIKDMVSARTLYTTGSTFSRSIEECSANKLQQKIDRSCNPGQKALFASTNFGAKIANEIAAMVNPAANGIQGILGPRPASSNSCEVSDQRLTMLKPLLFERKLNPEFVARVAALRPSTPEVLMNSLLDGRDGEIVNLIRQHPILESLLNEPQKFIALFQNLTSFTNTETLQDAFRRNLYTAENGDKLDTRTAQQCAESSSKLIAKICNSSFDNADISLGNFDNYKKVENDSALPTEESVGNETLLRRNMTALEFCEMKPNAVLNLDRDAPEVTSRLIPNDRDRTLASFANSQYDEFFGTPRRELCPFISADRCLRPGPTCDLFNVYKDSITPGKREYILANNPDRSVNNVLRAMVGSPRDLQPNVRQVLVAEGILPQTNGQFVERPTVPERQPDYLANVANGTINPRTETSASASTATTNRRPPNRPQGQAQIQPQGSTTAVQPDAQVAAGSQDEEDLRRFQEGLDERLRRVEGQQDPTAPQQPGQPVRRVASRSDSSRVTSRQPTGAFLPTSVQPQDDVVNPDRTAPIPQSADADLAPDTSRQTRAQRQANEARAQMAGARNNPAATTEAGRGPASVDGSQTGDSTVALTISGDIRSNLEQVLRGSDSRGSDLRSLIEARRPFRFQLNNSLFDVRITNGVYSVAYRSGDESQRALATTLQTLFNNSIRNADRNPARNTTLEALQNTVRN